MTETSAPLASLFASALLAASDAPRHQWSEWARDAVAAAQHHLCAFCNASLDAMRPQTWSVQPVISVSLGGPAASEFLRATCKPCANAKDQRDPLAWPEWQRRMPLERVEAVLALRRTALLAAPQHLTPHRPHSPVDAVEKHLIARFAHPRFRAWAWRGRGEAFVGWPMARSIHRSTREAMAVLLYGQRATRIPHPKAVLFALPSDRFLEAVWALIELHGWMCPVSIDAEPAPASDDWRESWPHTFTSLQDLRRRRRAHERQPLPSPPRDQSQSPSAVSHRRAYAKRREAERRHRDAVAQAGYRSRMGHVDEGRLPPLEFEDWAELYLDSLRHRLPRAL